MPVVVVEVGHRKIGLIVEELLSQQEVVIKVLRGTLRGAKGLAGATILGDGRVAMIVDVSSIVQRDTSAVTASGRDPVEG